MTAELVEEVTLRMPVGRDWTFNDLLQLPDDGRRYEIIDGGLHVSPAPSRMHQRVAGQLTRLLNDAAPDDLEALSAVAVDCGRSVLEPDVVVGLIEPADSYDLKFMPTDVRLAIEVVSPSSVRMDRLIKPSVLAQVGIPSYWRVELAGSGAPLIVVYGLDGEVYRELVTVRAGESATVDARFRVELRPADWIEP